MSTDPAGPRGGRPAEGPRPTLAEAEIAAARADPRLGRDERGVLADFWDYLAEAERTRFLAVAGVEELRGAVARERDALAREVVAPAEQERRLQAAAERSALADAESASGHPGLNALVLVGMLGALDAMVESLVPSLRAEVVWQQAATAAPDEFAAIEPDAADAVKRALLADTVAQQRKGRNRPWGSGAARWERLLAEVGLNAPPDRPLPSDLAAALAEAAALRHVLVHRAGRVDGKALADCPTLPYQPGELVRIDRTGYRTYSAAIRAYGGEVAVRLLALMMPREPLPRGNLTDWRDQHDLRA